MKLAELIGATFPEHQARLQMESEMDCVAGIKESRSVILIQYTALRGALRKSSMILSILDTQHRSSWEVKDHLFGGTAGFYLDFTFHVCEVKDQLFEGGR